MNLTPHQKWEWAYTLPPPATPKALVQTVEALVEDVAFTHVGQWRPYEVTIYIPPLMANHADMEKAQQQFSSWMHDRKCEWALRLGGTIYRIEIRAERMRI